MAVDVWAVLRGGGRAAIDLLEYSVVSFQLEPLFGWLQLESIKLQRFLAFAIGFTAITFLHISAGEQAPKWLAIQRPLPTTLGIAYPMLWFYRLSYPFVVLLNWSSLWLLRQAGITPTAEHGAHSEEEFRLVALRRWC